MKVAFLHFDLSGGPAKYNLQKIIAGIEVAVDNGAEWIITPETALQGYFFSEQTREKLDAPISIDALAPIVALAKKHKLHIYFCYAEAAETGHKYNSCAIIESTGIRFIQRKMSGHTVGAEAWSSKSNRFKLIELGGLRTGILICSDSWYIKNAETARSLSADLLIVPAAWNDFDCGGGMPETAWQRCSVISEAPVWVCNQTGNKQRLDFTSAKSAVVCGNKTRLCYSGREAILLFEWDEKTNCLVSNKFLIVRLN
ncbi:MAG TPA: carbon-nitrogen hydrolase family protein [Candidatus Avacidaminococcus intestinavium]|uniref:Carbon-nitrogen hydrolase family protein n=1 Tax=Candidatus Avacidaminococcus intestinavium TaxID=2840684 RepID=A0A9D1SL09_9FIRM|nr:carbon-nitrogen hydrolase family protein [Candidatus Avacidaminococcus intestinavium]